MNKIVMSLRQRSTTFQNSMAVCSVTNLTLRGPKKKKGPAKTEAPESSDIVNIFKDRPDAVIYPTERYPPWLMQLLNETYTPDDVLMQIYRGERIPDPKEQWTLAKSWRRTFFNDQNHFHRNDWEYESEEDDGEDLSLGMDDEGGPRGGAVEGGAEAKEESPKKEDKGE